MINTSSFQQNETPFTSLIVCDEIACQEIIICLITMCRSF